MSFGGLLTLEAVRHCTQIQSLVLIAPILYPRDAFANNIPTGITTDMEQDICTDLSKWTPPKLTLPTIAVFGG